MAVLVACGDDSTSTGGSGGGGEAGAGAGGNTSGGSGPGGGPSGGGGSGGTGGGPATNEDCESAQPLSMDPGDELTIPFTITERTGNEIESFCDDNNPRTPDASRDLVYEVTLSGACTFFATTSGPVDSEIIVRSVCDVQEFCFDGNPNSGETLALDLAAGTYFVIVQGDPASHTLALECAVPSCGDAVLNDGEDCDDGNVANDDGCDSGCKLEAPDASIEDCAAAEVGAAVTINPGLTYLPGAPPLASTLAAANNAQGTCQIPPNAAMGEVGSPDHVYRVRFSEAGTVTLKLGHDLNGVPFCGPNADDPVNPVEPSFPLPNGCWDRSLYVREANCANGTELDCSDSDTTYWQTETVTFSVVTDVDYFIFVDGWLAYSNGDDSFDRGIYTLEFDLN